MELVNGSKPSGNGHVHSRRHGRTRTGCLTCRARKKKCDERKSGCLGCERNGLLCSYSVPTKELRPTETLARAPPTLSKEKSKSTDKPKVVTPSKSTEAVAELHLSDPLLVASPLACILSIQALRAPTSRTLWDHFYHRSAPILSSWKGSSDNPYNNLILPVATHSDFVLHSILALSGVHYRNLTRSSTSDTQTWSHLAQALRGLKHALTNLATGKEQNAIPCLVSIAVLCMLETVRGDADGTVYRHLKAARELLKSTGHKVSADRLDASTSGFIADYFTYSESVSMTTEKYESQSLEPDASLSEDLRRVCRGWGVLCGGSYPLFLLVRDVTAKVRQASIEKDRLGDVSPATKVALATFSTQVGAWTPESNMPAEFATCSRIYQLAVLAYVQNALSSPDDILTSVAPTSVFDLFLYCLQSLPAGAPLCQTLSWPLVVVGCCMKEPHHRTAIIQRFEEMYRYYGIGNFLYTSKFLQEVWLDRDRHASQSLDINKLFLSQKLKHSFA